MTSAATARLVATTQLAGAPLKSVDDFNRELSEAGADDGEELLKRTEACLVKLGVDKGMFRSALDKLKKGAAKARMLIATWQITLAISFNCIIAFPDLFEEALSYLAISW